MQIGKLNVERQEMDYKTITEEEVETWCIGTFSNYEIARLTDILTGEYDLEEAREDVLSFRKKEL